MLLCRSKRAAPESKLQVQLLCCAGAELVTVSGGAVFSTPQDFLVAEWSLDAGVGTVGEAAEVGLGFSEDAGAAFFFVFLASTVNQVCGGLQDGPFFCI